MIISNFLPKFICFFFLMWSIKKKKLSALFWNKEPIYSIDGSNGRKTNGEKKTENVQANCSAGSDTLPHKQNDP